jgi:hypothetical protein
MNVPSNILQLYQQAAATYLPPGANLTDFTNVLIAQGYQESGFNPNPPVSPGGAMGIAQFIQSTWDGFAQMNNSPNYGQPYSQALNPAIAIPTQAFYMAQNYQATGSWTGALESYFAGPAGPLNPNVIPPSNTITPAQYAASILNAATSIPSSSGGWNAGPVNAGTPLLGGAGSALGAFFGDVGSAGGNAANTAGSLAQQGVQTVTNASGNVFGAVTAQVQSWGQTILHYVIILALALAILVVLDQMVTGGKGSQVLMSAALS